MRSLWRAVRRAFYAFMHSLFHTILKKLLGGGRR